MVTCDERDRSTERDHSDEHFIRYPVVIVEVLSPSTQRFDRAEKFADYKGLTSLQEYVLVSQDEMRVERYERQLDESWRCSVWTAGEEIHLRSLNFHCQVDDIYEDIDIPAPARPGL